jgi:aspartate kinase
MVILKFGGSSLGDAARIRHVAQLVRVRVTPGHAAVVCSAMGKVTDRLLVLVDELRRGSLACALSGAEAICREHAAALRELRLSLREARCVGAELAELSSELLDAVAAADHPGAPQLRDLVASFGERFSVRLMAAALRGLGVRARAVDASQFLVTTEQFGHAEPILPATRARAVQVFPPLLAAGVVPVVTGFLGATADGRITTLGRNSSDYSAAVLASMLDADELHLWTDVDGIFCSDPRTDDQAFLLRELSYARAGELARNGARVLHPRTLEPLAAQGITLWIKNTFRPDAPGTRIGLPAKEAVG